ncbi:MAG: type II methionyl aminopeptidase [Candidatus Bathyarchaeia archaeon]
MKIYLPRRPLAVRREARCGVLMDRHALESFVKAGAIAAETRRESERLVKEGLGFLDLCEKVEALIRQKGGQPAFPCNLCVNEVAAHDTAEPEDARVVAPRSVVKLDIGVHVDGFIADTALTVALDDRHEQLRRAVEQALAEAVKAMEPAVPANSVGKLIQESLRKTGFKPIWNLTGHEVGRYVIHAGFSIPNVSEGEKRKLEAGKVYAVEPFATTPNGAGEVSAMPEARIFRCTQYRRQRDEDEDLLLRALWEERRTLPFAERWLTGLLPRDRFHEAWERLKARGLIKCYQVLRESRGGLVAQAEHTVLIEERGARVLT